MNQRKITPGLLKELNQLEEERKRDQLENDKFKNKLSSQLKSFDRNEIKNTEFVDKKYTIWQRILRTLGIS
jgi:regulator of replication initiation timing